MYKLKDNYCLIEKDNKFLEGDVFSGKVCFTGPMSEQLLGKDVVALYEEAYYWRENNSSYYLIKSSNIVAIDLGEGQVSD